MDPVENAADFEVLCADALASPAGERSVDLDPPFGAFLGEIAMPFKMLIWGPPGSGKSTLALRMVDAMPESIRGLGLPVNAIQIRLDTAVFRRFRAFFVNPAGSPGLMRSAMPPITLPFRPE